MVNKNVIYSLSDNMCCHDEVTQLLSSQETFLRKNYAVTELFFGRVSEKWISPCILVILVYIGVCFYSAEVLVLSMVLGWFKLVFDGVI